MEDDEEVQSRGSAGSVSPSSSPATSNGRITVAVASTGPPDSSPGRPAENTGALALALPIPSSNSNSKANNGGGREDCWSEGATGVLIEAWGERYLELSRGNLKQKHWKEVADIVCGREDGTKSQKTDIQCKNRIDTVKKKYKQEKAKTAAGGGPSRWDFFEKLDRLIGPSAKTPGPVGAPSRAAARRVPVGIPMNTRQNSNPELPIRPHKKPRGERWRFKRRDEPETESESEPEMSADSVDSLPPPAAPPVGRTQKKVKEESGRGNSLGELTKAMLKFADVYEKAESAKLRQMEELEKQRMKFVKDLELQRMQFFVKTQLEISQMRRGRRSETGNASNDHCNNNNNNGESSG